MAGQNPEPMRADESLRQNLAAEASGAAEQATFHRIEAERYERIARAAVAALVELDAVSPVASVEVDALVKQHVGEDSVDPRSQSVGDGLRPGAPGVTYQ